MSKAYIITNFVSDVDIYLGYRFEKRYIYYSEQELYHALKDIIDEYHQFYLEFHDDTPNLSFEEFYNKFKLELEVSCISLNRKYIKDESSFIEFLNTLETIEDDKLKDYLLDFTDENTFWIDNNLNINETYCNIINTELKYQSAFSYKALFPDKYHVDKFKIGDKVLYRGEEYIILEQLKPELSIFESADPLNYLYGYVLGYSDGYVVTDDRFCYFPVDEDLELI